MPQIIQGLRTLKTNLDYGIFAALQQAAEAALALPEHYLEEVQNRYSTRRDFFNSRVCLPGMDGG